MHCLPNILPLLTAQTTTKSLTFAGISLTAYCNSNRNGSACGYMITNIIYGINYPT